VLRKTSDMIGFTVQGRDGEVGKVDDFYFDDSQWTVRYFVVNTGSWLFGRKVLVAPEAFDPPTWSAETFPINLTQEQVENSPDIDLDLPVSRQQETELREYYHWPSYWGMAPAYFSRPSVGGIAPLMASVPEAEATEEDIEEENIEEEDVGEDVSGAPGDPNLRSVSEVTGYGIHATDGLIGQIEDFFIDENDWRIHFVAVATRTWLPGKTVLISPDSIERVSWDDLQVHVNIDKESVRNSLVYDPKDPEDENAGIGLYRYFNIPA